MAVESSEGAVSLAGSGADGTGPSAAAPASAAADKARELATSQLSSQKDRAAEMVTSLARSLRQTGEGLEQSSPPVPVQRYIEQAADRLEQLGSFINEREVTEIVAEVEGFARRQPAVFLGAAFAAGLMASRFLKSSSGGSPSGSVAPGWGSDYGPLETMGER
jgi:hypothetical protein